MATTPDRFDQLLAAVEAPAPDRFDELLAMQEKGAGGDRFDALLAMQEQPAPQRSFLNRLSGGLIQMRGDPGFTPASTGFAPLQFAQAVQESPELQAAGARMGGAIGGAAMGAPLGPVGAVLGGIGGAFAAEPLARSITPREETLTESATNVAFGGLAIPAARVGTFSERLAQISPRLEQAAREATLGAAISGGQTGANTLLTEGRLPTAEEYAPALLGGGLAGGALGAALSPPATPQLAAPVELPATLQPKPPSLANVAAKAANASEMAGNTNLQQVVSQMSGVEPPRPATVVPTAAESASILLPQQFGLAEPLSPEQLAKLRDDALVAFRGDETAESAARKQLSAREGRIQKLVDEITGNDDRQRRQLLGVRRRVGDEKFLEALEAESVYKRNPMTDIGRLSNEIKAMSEGIAFQRAIPEPTMVEPTELRAVGEAMDASNIERAALGMVGGTPQELAALRRGLAPLNIEGTAPPASMLPEPVVRPAALPEPAPAATVKETQLRNALKQEGIDYQYVVFRPGMGLPDAIQVDVISPDRTQSLGSSNPAELNKLGAKIPEVPEWVPQGRYTREQLEGIIAARKATVAALKPSKKSKQPAPVLAEREFVTPTEDAVVGANSAGEALYERTDGSRYRMRLDRPDRPEGYPDFGGDLNPVSTPPTNALSIGEAKTLPMGQRAQGGQGVEPQVREQAGDGSLQAPRQEPLAFTPRAPVVNTPRFERWFQDSKVVNREGRPTVMYHGTGAAEDFAAFDETKLDRNALFGPGIYSTSSPDVAGGAEGIAGYASKGAGGAPRVIPLYVKIKNPFRADDFPEDWQSIAEKMDVAASKVFGDKYNGMDFDLLDRMDTAQNIDNGTLFQVLSRSFSEDGRANAQRVLKELGYDGVIHTGGMSARWNPNIKTPHTVAIAFKPEQVKSSIGNSGAFDPDSANISGFVTPQLVSTVGGGAAGGATGFATTERQEGESEEQFQARRLGNTLIGAAVGAGGGAALGALAQGARRQLRESRPVMPEGTPEPIPRKGEATPPPATAEGEGIRQTAEKVLGNRTYSEKLRTALAGDPEIIYDKFLLNDLADRVRVADEAGLTALRTSADTNERVAATIELANRYAVTDRAEEAAALYAEAAKAFTSPAQLLNVAKLVRSPAGYVKAIEEELKGINRQLTKGQKAEVNKLAADSIRADQKLAAAEEAARLDFSEANEVSFREAQRVAAESKRILNEYVQQLSPQGWGEIASKAMQGNLLTPLSLVANVYGNMAYQPVRRGAASIATALDAIYSGVTGKERTIERGFPLPTMGELDAAKEGIRVAARELISGPSAESYVKSEVQRGFRPVRSFVQAITGENMPVRADGTIALNDRAKKLVEGLIGGPPEIMFRFLSLGDKPFRRAAEAETLLEQARLRGLKGRDLIRFLEFPDAATQQLLDTEARRAIFAQDNKGARMVNTMLDSGMAQLLGVDKIPVLKDALKVFGRTIVPFRQFPINYVATALNFAVPELALAKAAYKASQGDRRAALQSVGEGAMGVMMYGAANWLWDNGLLSEPTEKDTKARSVQYEVMGPQRLNVSGLNRLTEGGDPTYQFGDTTVDWGKIGIPASVFYMFTRYANKKESEATRTGIQPAGEGVGAAVADRLGAYPGMAVWATDQSFLSGTSAFIEALRNPDPDGQELQNWAANTFRAVTSIPIPNSIEALARAEYQYIPELKGESIGDTLKNVWEYKTFQIPKDDRAILKRDLWGDPILRNPANKSTYLNQFLDVTRAEEKQAAPYRQKLLELYQRTDSPDVYPGLPTRNYTVDGVTVKLKPQDYEDYQELVGKNRRTVAEYLTSNPQFDALPSDEVRIMVLQKGYAEASANAREMMKQLPGFYQSYPELAGMQPAAGEESRVISRTPEARARQQLQSR